MDYQGYYGIKAAMNFLPITKAKFFQNIKGSLSGLMNNIHGNPFYKTGLHKALGKKYLDKLKTKPFYSKLTPQQKSLLEADCIKDSNFAKFLDDGGEGAQRAWSKLAKEGDAVSGALKGNPIALDWFIKYGDNVPKSVVDKLFANLNGRQITEVLEDAQKRMVVVIQSTGAGGATTVVATVEKTASGQ